MGENFTAFLLGQAVRRSMGAAKTPVVGGVWVFNSSTLSFVDADGNPYFAKNEPYNIRFVSDSVEYSSMTFYTTGNGFIWWMKYGDVGVYSQFEDFFISAHATVDFGTTPQTVTEAFYNWLTANAVKQ